MGMKSNFVRKRDVMEHFAIFLGFNAPNSIGISCRTGGSFLVVYLCYLQKRETINGEYYANLLQRLADGFGEKESVASAKKCTSSIRYRAGPNQ